METCMNLELRKIKILKCVYSKMTLSLEFFPLVSEAKPSSFINICHPYYPWIPLPIYDINSLEPWEFLGPSVVSNTDQFGLQKWKNEMSL